MNQEQKHMREMDALVNIIFSQSIWKKILYVVSLQNLRRIQKIICIVNLFYLGHQLVYNQILFHYLPTKSGVPLSQTY